MAHAKCWHHRRRNNINVSTTKTFLQLLELIKCNFSWLSCILVVDKWYEQISRETVPVILYGIDGCDGATYQLNFYNGLNISRYQWWCEAPEGYRLLVEFGNVLLEAVGEDDRLEIYESID